MIFSPFVYTQVHLQAFATNNTPTQCEKWNSIGKTLDQTIYFLSVGLATMNCFYLNSLHGKSGYWIGSAAHRSHRKPSPWHSSQASDGSQLTSSTDPSICQITITLPSCWREVARKWAVNTVRTRILRLLLMLHWNFRKFKGTSLSLHVVFNEPGLWVACHVYL